MSEARAAEERLKAQLAQANSARQALTVVVQDVTRRLQAAGLVRPDAEPGELLSGLDRALERRPGGDAATPAPATPDPARASTAFARGFSAYRAGNWPAAERSLTAAVQADASDARYHYFLGLARLAQGKGGPAVEDFRRGAALERQNQPNAAEVDRALELMPRDARQAVNRYRP